MSSIARALLVAGLFIAATAAIQLLSPEYVSQSVARRSLGVMLGLFVVVYANAVPKALRPLAQMKCDPVAEQAKRRFVGWSITLGGAAFAAVWVLAPLESTDFLSMGVLGASVLLVVGRLTLGRKGKSV